jgi:hypothetical protein
MKNLFNFEIKYLSEINLSKDFFLLSFAVLAAENKRKKLLPRRTRMQIKRWLGIPRSAKVSSQKEKQEAEVQFLIPSLTMQRKSKARMKKLPE